MNDELIALEEQRLALQAELEASLLCADTAAMAKAKSKLKKLRAEIEFAQSQLEPPSTKEANEIEILVRRNTENATFQFKDETPLQPGDVHSHSQSMFKANSNITGSFDLDQLRNRLSALSLSEKARLELRTNLLVEEMVARNSSNIDGGVGSMTTGQILTTASQSIIAELEELEANQKDEPSFEEQTDSKDSQPQTLVPPPVTPLLEKSNSENKDKTKTIKSELGNLWKFLTKPEDLMNP